MVYREKEAREEDRPAFVRAASGCAWWGDRLAVVQDDASFIGLVDPQTGLAEVVTLPSVSGVRQFHRARGNRLDKPDLEAVFVLGEMLVAVGSGSLPVREVLCICDPSPRWMDASALFAALSRAWPAGEMNLEGATVLGDFIWLFRRATATSSDAVARIRVDGFSAWVRGGPLPPIEGAEAFSLGEIEGVRLGVTCATTWDGDVWISAAAEDAPDAVEDGPVVGSAVGRIRTHSIDLWRVDAVVKVEGLARYGDGFVGVIDPDDPDVAADLLHIILEPS